MKYWEIRSGGIQTTNTYYAKGEYNPLEDRLENGEPNPYYLGYEVISNLEEDWYNDYGYLYNDCDYTLEDFDGDEDLLEEACRQEIIDTNYGISCKEIDKEDIPSDGLDFQ